MESKACILGEVRWWSPLSHGSVKASRAGKRVQVSGLMNQPKGSVYGSL